MAITRTAIVDDDGSGETGTALENAWKQELYDQIDAALVAALGLAPNGTAGAPSFSFAADPDTGWYSPGAGELAATINGTPLVDLFTGQIRMKSTVLLGWASGDPTATGADTVLTRAAANRLQLATGDVFNLEPTAFASLPAGAEGDLASVNNSTKGIPGATIAGGGSNKVLAFHNGTNWKVVSPPAGPSTEASSATPTINTDNVEAHSITALAAAITSMTTNLSGTPTNFQKLIIRIKDNGTARAITWGASFVAMGAPLPTTTVISKVTTVGFLYDTVIAKWGCVSAVTEA